MLVGKVLSCLDGEFPGIFVRLRLTHRVGTLPAMHIEGRKLGRRFGRKLALYETDFTCRGGEVISLIGNNGAGKTTLLQLIAGLLVPTSGGVYIDGTALDRSNEKQRQRMAIIPDFPPFFAEQTVLAHFAMVCSLYGVDDGGLEDRALELMEEAGILELGRTRMEELSRGEVYKTVLVGLLLVSPDLWLLDEPMASGMDPRGLNFLRARLREAVNRGAVVIYTTQIAEVAERFADRVFVLDEGRLLARESPQSLIIRTGAVDLDAALRIISADPA